MAQFFEIHPESPQLRLIHRAVEIIRKGGVIVYPTDSSYAIACHIGDKQALDKIRRIRQLDDKHNFTLVCKDLAQVSMFTKIGNDAYRLIKALTPGAFYLYFGRYARSAAPLAASQEKNGRHTGSRSSCRPIAGSGIGRAVVQFYVDVAGRG